MGNEDIDLWIAAAPTDLRDDGRFPSLRAPVRARGNLYGPGDSSERGIS
jgi:hypothetical protein